MMSAAVISASERIVSRMVGGLYRSTTAEGPRLVLLFAIASNLHRFLSLDQPESFASLIPDLADVQTDRTETGAECWFVQS